MDEYPYDEKNPAGSWARTRRILLRGGIWGTLFGKIRICHV